MKIVRWETSCSMRTDRQTDRTYIIVAITVFPTYPKTCQYNVIGNQSLFSWDPYISGKSFVGSHPYSSVTAVRTGRSGFRFPTRSRDFSSLQNTQNCCWTKSCSVERYRVSPRGWSGRGVKLITTTGVRPRMYRPVHLFSVMCLHVTGRHNFTSSYVKGKFLQQWMNASFWRTAEQK